MELRDYVSLLDRENVSAHLHYSTYYSPELAELVFLRERAIIERFGYRFEQLYFEQDSKPPVHNLQSAQ